MLTSHGVRSKSKKSRKRQSRRQKTGRLFKKEEIVILKQSMIQIIMQAAIY